MLPALLANAAAYACGIGSVFKVVPAGCGQRGLQLGRPLLVGLRQPPHLVRSQTEFAERGPERLAAVDRIQELLAHLHWQPALRSGSPEFSLLVTVRLAAEGAATAAVPARVRAVRGLPHSGEGSEITAPRAAMPFPARIPLGSQRSSSSWVGRLDHVQDLLAHLDW